MLIPVFFSLSYVNYLLLSVFFHGKINYSVIYCVKFIFMGEKRVFMNYDHATGLPTPESFIDFAKKMWYSSTPGRFAILSVRPDSLFDFHAHNDLQAQLISQGLIRKHHDYMLSACKFSDHTYAIFVDMTQMMGTSTHITISEVLKQISTDLEVFTDYINTLFPNKSFHIYGGLCTLDNSITTLEKALNNALLAQGSIHLTSVEKASLILYQPDLEKKQLQAHDRIHILPIFEDIMMNNHLLVYLQPIFDVNSAIPIGAEALVRIMDINGKMLKPKEFLPVLEESGVSYKLDLMVIEKILRLITNWSANHIKPIPISVNLSEPDFSSEDFYKIFYELMEKYAFAKEYLKFEISEDTFFHNSTFMTEQINHFHDLGFDIILDAFSKKDYHRNPFPIPPVDMIKLSRQVWYTNMGNENDYSNFKKLSYLFENCNISVMCEGVECKSEEDFARFCGVQYAQGFYYDRPVPLDLFQKKYMEYYSLIPQKAPMSSAIQLR